MVRNVLIGLGSLVATLFALLLAVPFIVDVDQYRPQIVSFANEQLDGELSVGKLSLSLWGRVAVNIDGIQLKDHRGEELLNVEEASALFPFSSLFGGQPKLTLKLVEPNIHVIRSRDAKINALAIVKSSSKAAAKPKQKADASSSTKVDLADVPFLDVALATGVDLDVVDARFRYDDNITGLEQAVEALNLSIIDLSLKRPMRLKMWTDVDTKMGADLRVRGPLKVFAKVSPQFEQVEFQKADVQLSVDLDEVRVDVPGTFTKKSGEPANIKLALAASPSEVELKDFRVNFLKATAEAKGKLSRLNAPPEVARFDLTAKNPGLDLKLGLDLSSLAVPQVKLDLQAKDIDLDVLLPAPSGGRVADVKEPAADAGKGEPAPAVDVDALLEPIRKSSFFRTMGADVKVNIARLKGFRVEAKNLQVDASFRKLVASLERFSVDAFGGSIKASSRVDLKPRMPGYRFNGQIENLMVDDPLATFVESFKNTVKGELTASVKGFGRSFNGDKILGNLNVNGEFGFKNAVFATIDVGRMVQEGLNQSAEKIKKKVPQLGGKSFKELPQETSKYEYVGGNFALQNSVFRAPNFEVRAVKGKGVDLKGATKVDLAKDELTADWFVIDRHDYLGMKNVNIEESGVSIPSVFLKPGQAFQFPISVGCKLSAPCYKYASIPEFLSNVALSNLSRGLKGVAKKKLDAAKKEVNKKIDEQKKRLDAEKKKRLAELEKKKKQTERRAKQKIKDEAEKKLKGKAKDKAMDALNKLGF